MRVTSVVTARTACIQYGRPLNARRPCAHRKPPRDEEVIDCLYL